MEDTSPNARSKVMLSKQPLSRWYHICADTVRTMPHELTMRQWTILIHIYLVPERHTVKSLSEQFAIPKPAICRALDTLSIMGLVKRVKDQRDRRNVMIEKTMSGIAFLNHFHDILDRYESAG